MREYTRDSTRENCHLRRRRLGGVQGDDIGAEATLFRMMMKSISRVIEKKNFDDYRRKSKCCVHEGKCCLNSINFHRWMSTQRRRFSV